MANQGANTHQNTPSADDLDRQIAEDSRQQDAALAAEQDNSVEEEIRKPIKGPKQYPASVRNEEVEEENKKDDQENPEEKTEEKEPDLDESTQERIRRLAFERRERDRQIRELNDEISRLRGEKPPRPDEEEINRRANEIAQFKVQKQEFDNKCINLRNEGNKKYSDFEQSLAALNREQFLTNDFVDVLLDVDNPAGVLDYLGKNVDVAEDIYKMTPHKRGVALSKIANKVSTPMPPKPQSKAAPPIKPLNGSGRAPSNIETMSLKDFMDMEDKKTVKRSRWG